MIYIAGGSQYYAGKLIDETIFEKFDPATNTLTASPTSRGHERNHGYNVGGQL